MSPRWRRRAWIVLGGVTVLLKLPTIVSVTDTPPDTARNGTEWIWP